jgi:hypothetical protein
MNNNIYKYWLSGFIMTAWHKVAMAAVILTFLIPLLAAATTEKARLVLVEKYGYNITAAVVEIEAPEKKSITELWNEYRHYRDLFIDTTSSDSTKQALEEALNKLSQQKGNINVTTIKDANISFYYYDADRGYILVPGCERVTASNVTRVKGILDPNNPDADDGPYYYALCTIPIQQPPFRGTCKNIIAVFIPPPGEKGAFQGTESVCDMQGSDITAFTNGLATLLTPSSPGCFTAFILFALLLASMFFSGKSPISLLDLTTPRLPSPKGLAAGGQVLTPFGYGEMKATTTKKIEAAKNVFKQRYGSLMTGVVQLAKKYGAEKEALTITRKGEKINTWGKNEHEAFGKMITAIEKGAKVARDKKALLDAKILQDWYIANLQLQRLNVLTGHPDVAKQGPILKATETFVKHTVGRLRMVGPMVGATIASGVRSARVMGRFTKAITGAPIRAMVGEKKLKKLEETAKTSPSAKVFYDWLTAASGAKLQVGGFYPIKDRAAMLYRTLHSEAYHDMIKYALKQLYKKYGMRFDIDIQEMVTMGYKDIDILARSGFRRNEELARIEDEIKNILSKSHYTPQQKYEMIVSLLETKGVRLDPSLKRAASKIEEIEKSNVEEHIKLVTLYEYLSTDHNIQNSRESLEKKIKEPDKFNFSMGHDRMAPTEYWENLVLRRLIYDAENGLLTGRIEDILKATWLYLINRMNSLAGRKEDLPEFYTAEELQKIQKRAIRYAVDLMTEDGIRKFEEYYGFNPRVNLNKVTVDHLMSLLYGGEEIIRKYKLAKDTFTAHVGPDGRAYWWGSDKELGPDPRWWKVDMKRNWLDSSSGGWGDLALARWVQLRFTKSYVPPYKAEIERALNDKYADVKTWTPEKIKMRTMDAKKMWLEHLLEEDLKSFMNSIFAQNAYGQTNETVYFYSKIMAAFLAAMLREKGVPDDDAQIRMLESLDLTKKQDRRTFIELLKTYDAEFSEFLKKPVTYDTIAKSKYPMVMLHEGGIAPYIKGMALSDYDRPLGGYVAIRDNNGRYRRFDQDHVRISFEGRPELEQLFTMLSKEKDKTKWNEPLPQLGNKSFLEAVKEWAGNDFERQKVFNGVLWRYANTTDDWKGFWNESAITIKAKRDVVPLSPLTWRMFTKGEMPGVEKLQKVRNFLLSVGDFISRASLAAGGPLLEASYAITPFSEYFRQQSWHLARMIKTLDEKDWDIILSDVASPAQRKKLRAAYEEVAMSHFPYHQVWDYAIDRNPWRSSTSYGAYQAWGSFFHYGPFNPFPLRTNYRAYLTRGEYIAWEIQNWPMRVARSVGMPFVHIIRGAQQAMQGYPSRWDTTFSPMRQWDYTPPRVRDFLSVLNPITTYFSVHVPETTGKIGTRIANYYNQIREMVFGFEFKNPLVYHDLAGGTHMSRGIGGGLKQAPQDIFFIRKGVYASARTGEANPGCSYYDYRFVLQLDNSMAEYLAYRAGEQSAYFRQNEYVMEQAMKNTVKREVDGVALAMRREHELRGFGVLQNTIYGWFSPPLFLWHLPLYPQISPKELVTGIAQRIRFGGVRGNVGQMFKDMAERAYYATNRGITSWRSWRVVYCPVCQTAGYRGSVCRNCKTVLY